MGQNRKDTEMKVEVAINQVEEMVTKVKYDEDLKALVAVVQLKVKASPIMLARLANLQQIEAPLYCIIGSNQAAMDLGVDQKGIIDQIVPAVAEQINKGALDTKGIKVTAKVS